MRSAKVALATPAGDVQALALQVSRINQTLGCRVLSVLKTFHADRPISVMCPSKPLHPGIPRD